MKTFLCAIALVLVSCGNVTFPDPNATPTPTPSPTAKHEQNNQPDNKTPTGSFTPPNSDRAITVIEKSISHLPTMNSLTLDCADREEVKTKDYSFLEGDLQDVWSADQLVVATVTLKTQFVKDTGHCDAETVIPQRTVVAEFPQFITVESGNAGNGLVTITLGHAWCVYQGGASVADPLHPFRANEAYKGMQYHISLCSSGIDAGAVVYAKFLGVFAVKVANGEDLQVRADIKVRYPIYSTEELE